MMWNIRFIQEIYLEEISLVFISLLVDMVLTEKYGYYHATNESGYISWADFAIWIF